MKSNSRQVLKELQTAHAKLEGIKALLDKVLAEVSDHIFEAGWMVEFPHLRQRKKKFQIANKPATRRS